MSRQIFITLVCFFVCIPIVRADDFSSATITMLEPKERVLLYRDMRQWVVGHKQTSDEGTIIELIPKGQAIEGWSELLSYQYVAGSVIDDVAMQEVVNTVETELRKGCPSLYWQIVAKDSGAMLYEWRHEVCRNEPPQHGLARIIRGEFGTVMVHYVAKKSQLSDAARQQWLNLLKKVTISSRR